MKKVFFAVLLMLCAGIGRGQTPCTASFTYTLTSPSGVIPATYSFTGNFLGGGAGPVIYTWNFGDSSAPLTTITASLTHTYTSSRQYCVTMTADNGMCLASNSHCFTAGSTPVTISSCNASVTKSGTGMTRTYTVTSSAANPQYSFSHYDYDSMANVVFSTTNPATYIYTQPGYYTTKIAVSDTSCLDSLYLTDTVLGPVDCNTITHSLGAQAQQGWGANFNFYPSGQAASYIPYYSRHINYTYGDGTSGTYDYHTYPSPGSYLVTAITTLYNPTYGTCTLTDTVTANVISRPGPFDCSNILTDFVTVSNTLCGDYVFANASSNLNSAPATPYHSWEVTNYSSGGPQWVQFSTSDSAAFYTFPSTGTYGVRLVTTWMNNGVVICKDSFTDYNLNASVFLNSISASATWDTTNMNSVGASVKFWLIQYDSSTQMLNAVDSATVPYLGGLPRLSHEFFNGIMGNYRVKAHMINQPSSWATGLLPTYSDSSYNWQNATVTNIIGCSTVNYVEVYLLQGISLTGPGFIGGLVTQGANKGTAVGDPIPNLTIFLRNAANNPVASTETDASGNYSFSGVPLGSYNVYPEALSFTTTPSANLQITATTTNLTGNNFKYEPGMMQINPVSLSVSNIAASEVVISPNPAKDILTIQFAQAPEKGAVIRLLNLNGQVVHSEIATQTMQMSVSNLAAGTYLLQVPGGNATYRIAVQK